MNNLNFFIEDDIEFILNESVNELKKLSGKSVLISGGLGFIGKYINQTIYRYNQKNKNPIKVIVVDNLMFNQTVNQKNFYDKNFSFINHDASLPLKILEDIDFIIHAAGIASPFYYRSKPLETLDVAISGTRNLLELARKKKSNIIFFSSSEIYGDPDSNKIPIKEEYRGNVSPLGPRACYDESKRLGETLCYIYKNYYNVDVKIVRPFNIYGPGMAQNDYRILPNFANCLKNNIKFSVYGSGKQTRTYCYISDAINGFLKVLLNGASGEAYNIGNLEPEISIYELIEKISKVINKKIEFENVNYPSSYPSDEPQRRNPDISKANKDLNYFPKIKIEDGLNKFFNWADKNYIKN